MESGGAAANKSGQALKTVVEAELKGWIKNRRPFFWVGKQEFRFGVGHCLFVANYLIMVELSEGNRNPKPAKNNF